MSSSLDRIAPLLAAWRKLAAFRSVAQRGRGEPREPVELLTKISALQRELGGADLATQARGLWAMERLGCSFGRCAGADHSLAHATLSAACRPIAHVGMGVAAVERAGFDAQAITQLIEVLADPEEDAFAFESIGAMLGVYERWLPPRFVGLRRLELPSSLPAFVAEFEPEQRRLIAHGYGRMLFFDSFGLRGALGRIASTPGLEPLPLAQGVGFAHVMVNHADLERALSCRAEDPALNRALAEGMRYALLFWAWLFPAALDGSGLPMHEHVDAARELRAHASARLPAFFVG